MADPQQQSGDNERTTQYETKLAPEEEKQFQTWKSRYAPKDSGYDYDLRGAFKAGLKPDAASGHWPDTYKKPNHPTFSNESIYAKDRPDLAGHWEGEKYIPHGGDIVSTFQNLPRERQKSLLGRMSPEQKQKLSTAIQQRISAKKTTVTPQTQKLPPEPSTLGKVARGAALGAFEGAGVKPAATAGEVIGGTFQQFGKGIKGTYMGDVEEAKRSPLFKDSVLGPYAMAGISFPARVLEQAAQGIEQGIGGVRQAVQNKDWESASEHAASTLTQIAMLRGTRKAATTPLAESEVLSRASRIAEEGVSPALTQQSARRVIQKHLFDRAEKVQAHVNEVEKAVKARDSSNWQHIEKTVDNATPEGAIDLGKIGRETGESVKQAVKIPEKVPQVVRDVAAGAKEPPMIAGLTAADSRYAPMLKKLIESGGITEDDIPLGPATFAKVRQFRTKLGRELQSPSLSGESRAVGWKLYNELTSSMRDAAGKHGLAGAFKDANEFHAQYRDDFGKGTPLGKVMAGDNPHEIVGPLSSAKTAEQARRAAGRYKQFGANPAMLDQEAKIFSKYKSGLPRQIPLTRWELLGDVGAVTGALTLGRPEMAAAPIMAKAVREAYNFAQRAKAVREVRAQSISEAAQKLGPKASIKEIMEEADRNQPLSQITQPSVPPSPVAPISQPAPTTVPAPANREVTVTPESQRPSAMGGTAGRVMSAIEQEGGNLIGIGRLAEATGLSKAEVSNILNDLQKSGRIEVHRSGWEADAPIFGAQLKQKP